MNLHWAGTWFAVDLKGMHRDFGSTQTEASLGGTAPAVLLCVFLASPFAHAADSCKAATKHQDACQKGLDKAKAEADNLTQNIQSQIKQNPSSVNPSSAQTQAIQAQQSLLSKAITSCEDRLVQCQKQCGTSQSSSQDPCAKALQPMIDQAKSGNKALDSDGQGSAKSAEKSGSAGGGGNPFGNMGSGGGGSGGSGDSSSSPQDTASNPSTSSGSGSNTASTQNQTQAQPTGTAQFSPPAQAGGAGATNASNSIDSLSQPDMGRATSSTPASGSSSSGVSAGGQRSTGSPTMAAVQAAPKGLKAFDMAGLPSNDGGGGGGGYSYGSGYQRSVSGENDPSLNRKTSSNGLPYTIHLPPVQQGLVGDQFGPKIFHISSEAYQKFAIKNHIRSNP